MDNYQVNATDHGIPVVKLCVTEQLCAPTVPALQSAIAEVLTVRPTVLVIDLSQCPVIDAAGIALLLDVHRRLRRDRAGLRVHAPTPTIRRLLHVARVDHVLEITPAAPPEGTTAISAAGPTYTVTPVPLRAVNRSTQHRRITEGEPR